MGQSWCGINHSKKEENKRSEQFYCASKKIGDKKCKYQCFDCKDYRNA